MKMRFGLFVWAAGHLVSSSLAASGAGGGEEGPAAALAFARAHRNERYAPGELHCYPGAVGVPFSECANIVPMTEALWRPEQIRADFEWRMQGVPAAERKRGIIVLLKTERCATKIARLCTVTTAALEKRSTPLAGEFLIYGVWLKPRDGDDPPGTLKIETGAEAWKNEAAGRYGFVQGPGATLAMIDPRNGEILERTDAVKLRLFEAEFRRNKGRTPVLHAMLEGVLKRIERAER